MNNKDNGTLDNMEPTKQITNTFTVATQQPQSEPAPKDWPTTGILVSMQGNTPGRILRVKSVEYTRFCHKHLFAEPIPETWASLGLVTARA